MISCARISGSEIFGYVCTECELAEGEKTLPVLRLFISLSGAKTVLILGSRDLYCVTIGYVGFCYTCSVLCSYRIWWHMLHVFCVV